MALLLDLVSTAIVLVTKPLSLAKLSCLFGLRSIFLVIQTWIELFRAVINFQLNILWRVIIWVIAILSLPVRALTALEREKMVSLPFSQSYHLLFLSFQKQKFTLGQKAGMTSISAEIPFRIQHLEIRIQQMQTELENMIWHRKKLEEELKLAIKERRMMKMLLAELEDEHDEAICKMERLGGELQDLKAENHWLKEVQCKSFWSSRAQNEGDMGNEKTVKEADKFGISLPQSTCNGSYIKGQDVRYKDNWKEGNKSKSEMHAAMTAVSETCGLVHPYCQDTVSLNSSKIDVLEQRREVALSRSSFSAILSLLVGMIVWEARDPCMPLVLALFIVVVMSLMSVLRFFSTIKNKPAVDAVALLSLNWFILGTLTYPTLPIVAGALAPFIFHALEKMANLCFAFLT